MFTDIKNVIAAIVVRVGLIVHGLLCVWRAADVVNNDIYWLLALTNVFLIVEGIYTIVNKDSQESKWFSPCILFYLMGTVPAIWILEIDRLEKFTEVTSSINLTSSQGVALSTINGVTLPVKLDSDTWLSILEQSMLFIFILARWILPRGRISRDQLSQLLFVYIGSASDVMELFVVFEEPEIRSDLTLSYVTLGVWSLSLFQFCLILTATRDSRGKILPIEIGMDEDVQEDTPEGKQKEENPTCCNKVFELELWSLFIAMFMQDGPFLGVRLYAMIVKGVLSYGILFFTAKNVLMLFLQVYRMIVICVKEKKSSKQSMTTDLASNSTRSSTCYNDEFK